MKEVVFGFYSFRPNSVVFPEGFQEIGEFCWVLFVPFVFTNVVYPLTVEG